MSRINEVRGETERQKDETQRTQPNIDTSIGVTDTLSLDDLFFLLPALAVVSGGLVLYVLGLPAVILVMTSVLAALLAAGGLGIVLLSHEYTTPEERWEEWKQYFSMRREMPIRNTIAAELRHHNVRRLFRDGTAELDDGTLVGLCRVHPRTTDNMTYGEIDSLVANLSQQVDEAVGDFDFKFHSSSREHDIEGTISGYRDRAYSGALDRASGYMGEFARSLVEWFEEVDQPAQDPHEMHHYVVVRVEPDDDDVRVRSSDSASDSARSRWLPSLTPTLSWRSFVPFVANDTDEDSIGIRKRKKIQSELHGRLSTVETKMFSGVDGVEVDRVSPEEHAEVLLAYWTGEQHDPDENLERRFNRDRDGPSVWPPARIYKTGDGESAETGDTGSAVGSARAQHRLRTGVSRSTLSSMDAVDVELASGHFEAKKGYLEIGEQYAMALWIADYPTDIESGFLKSLYAMDDIDHVDIDVTIDVTAVDKDQAIEEEREHEANAGAKSQEQTEIESRGTDKGAGEFADNEELLRETQAQAWDVSAYVVVRAGPRAALKTVEDDDYRNFDDFHAAKMGALQDGKDAVLDILESTPVEATVIKPDRSQREVFESCSPNLGNVYNDVLADESEPGAIEKRIETLLGDAGTSGPRQKRVLGGFLGAAFPPGAQTINEPGGLNWGRDVETDLPFRTNPAMRGTAGHMITFGVSRSGKTYGSSSAAAAWFMERDNRTLVVADTQGGFAGLTQMLGGEHIVLEGDTRLNPLDIQAPPEGHEDINAYRKSVETTTNFFKSVLRGQGVDGSRYHSIIEDGIEATYRSHGIEAGAVDPDPDLGMPTVEDLLETWQNIQSNPGEYTTGDPDTQEADIKAEKAAQLLDKLSGFAPGRKYGNLLGESTLGLLDDDVDMAYLDLSQLETDNDAEESAMMSLAQSQVTQKVRQTPGEKLVLVDEAHQLLHSDEMVTWLQKQFREVARYNAYYWLVSQHPSEFLSSNSEGANSDKKRALVDQCSQIQIYNMPRANADVLGEFVPHADHALVDTIKNGLTAAREHKGYTECVMEVTDNDKPGWHRVQVEASPFEDYVFHYTPSEHGNFDEYMARFLHGSALAPVEQDHDHEQVSEDDTDSQQGVASGGERGGGDGLPGTKIAEMYAESEDTQAEAGSDANTNTTPPRDEHGRFVSAEGDD